ncbi:MAG: class I SAM-dependent methyltransferase [Terracidiphilus sp.]
MKSVALQSDTAYRLSLRLRFGTGKSKEIPDQSVLNGTLQSTAEWQNALDRARQLRLPLHRSDEKNWDHLAAVYTILNHTSPSATVLDAGAELYSNVLPALFTYGYRNLYGINLDFKDPARRGPIRYQHGDITRSDFANDFFDAVTCMSVIEHGVPLDGYFREMYRILKPGGLLITSTDYFPEPVDTRGQNAHGAPIKVFHREEIQKALMLASGYGFEETGEVGLECTERSIRWAMYDLDYSFILFTLRKPRG